MNLKKELEKIIDKLIPHDIKCNPYVKDMRKDATNQICNLIKELNGEEKFEQSHPYSFEEQLDRDRAIGYNQHHRKIEEGIVEKPYILTKGTISKEDFHSYQILKQENTKLQQQLDSLPSHTQIVATLKVNTKFNLTLNDYYDGRINKEVLYSAIAKAISKRIRGKND